ncbi:MAG: AMP-binding protein, partial [Acidobacteriota bacterium]|nr:AMP-binding protein [Acidobacteriota bacterium]
ITGGCLHLIPRAAALHAETLANYCARYPMDVMKFAPSHLAALHDEVEPSRIMPKRLLGFGGEALRSDFYRALPQTDCRIINHYGPTETTVAVLVSTLNTYDAEDLPVTAPIGLPLANTSAYMLDDHLQPVPAGVPGRLYIGGDNVTRGYVGRPALTAAAFVPDPFEDTPGARLYNTGDTVQRLPDGAMVFVGRGDDQVKLRGFRVETGEVRAGLLTHPAVADALVSLVDQRLVAWVRAPKDKLTADALRTHVAAHIPAHMVPSWMGVLDAFPLSAHGKVDLRALPKPGVDGATPAESVTPRTDAERRITAIWQAVLQREVRDVHTNFFDLGGHSLLAVKLMARIAREFGRDLPLTAVFSQGTVAQLATLLASDAVQDDQPLVPIRTEGAGPTLYCIHPVGGSVLCYHDLAKMLDRPVYGLQAVTEHDTVPTMATAYLAAIREHQPEGPIQLAGWSSGGVIAYEMARQLEAAGKAVPAPLLFDTHVPGHVTQPELDPVQKLVYTIEDMAYAQGKTITLDVAELRALPPEARWQYLSGAAQAQGMMQDVNPTLLQHLWTIYQRNEAANAAYTPKPFGGSIQLFRATATQQTDPTKGWGFFTEVVVHDMDADHLSIITKPESLAAIVARCKPPKHTSFSSP